MKQWWGWFGSRMREPGVIWYLRLIVRQLNAVLRLQGTIMADLTKLQQATARIETAITNLPPPQPDQQPEIDAVSSRLETAAAALEARGTPPGPPTT